MGSGWGNEGGVDVLAIIFDGGEEWGEILVEMSSGKNRRCDF